MNWRSFCEYLKAKIYKLTKKVDSFPVPTEVVANPTLAGTESDLEGLQVGNTKYKVPSGGGTEVVANPTLAGTEADLTGLQVGNTKYKVPSGTEVVANPTLAGTESDLESLQVGNTKYKVPLNNLYRHEIELTVESELCVHCVIINKNSTQITLASFLNNAPRTGKFAASGFYFIDSNYITVFAYKFVLSENQPAIQFTGFKSSSSNYDIKTRAYSSFTVVDTVTEI